MKNLIIVLILMIEQSKSDNSFCMCGKKLPVDYINLKYIEDTRKSVLSDVDMIFKDYMKI